MMRVIVNSIIPYFCCACLSLAFLRDGDILDLERTIHEHHKLFASVFGEEELTVNFHKLLHLPDHVRAFGAPKSFSVSWCCCCCSCCNCCWFRRVIVVVVVVVVEAVVVFVGWRLSDVESGIRVRR